MLRRVIPGPAIDDKVAVVDASGAVSYFHTDRLGSVVAVSNGAGSASETYAFSPYGVSANPVTGNPWRYTGRYLDAETGLYYYRARYYSPRLGQFLQTDPIGSKDDPNLYMYVGNDPIGSRDPTGTRCVVANADSVYCLRRDIYRVFDRTVGDSTRFFGAAALTVEFLANMDIPVMSNLFVSDQAKGFLRGVSASLYSLNAQTLTRIERGELSGPNLDRRLVHMEQTRVQEMLDALPEEARAAIVSSLNGAFNSPARGLSNLGSSSDTRYNRVLSGVIQDLGRPIDFGNQGDREAIGNALIDDLRSHGDCTRTGSRIPTC